MPYMIQSELEAGKKDCHRVESPAVEWKVHTEHKGKVERSKEGSSKPFTSSS